MTRAELSAILSDLVRRAAITLADARATLARFDAGALTDLPLSATQQESHANSWVLAVALLLFLLGGHTRRTLNALERKRAQRLLRAQYEAKVAQMAAAVAVDGLVATWQAGMQSAVADYARQMAVAGAGTLPSVAVQTAIEDRLTGQWPFLAAFAVQILARAIGGRPMSEAWINQRARKYGGPTGWASFFQAEGSRAMPGYVDVWVTRDDHFVCPNCSPRHQKYFMPGKGVMPGDDCYGDCRCKRIPEYLPNIYADLSGQRSAQIHPVRQRELAGSTKRDALDKKIAERIKRTRGQP
jgi:hypothetical protein